MPIIPVSRFLVLCESATVDPANAQRMNLMGVISAFRAKGTPSFPVVRPEFVVYTQLTDCRGPVTGHVRVIRADDGTEIASTPDRTFPLPMDPLEVAAISIKVRNCTFPAGGLYWVQSWCERKLVQEAPLVVR
jgi:hypothetical protein